MIRIETLPTVLDHDGQLQHYLRNRYPDHDYPFRSDSWRMDAEAKARAASFAPLNSLPGVPDCEVNQIIIPGAGASRYGRGLVVMDRERAYEVIQKAWHPLEDTWDGTEPLPDPKTSDELFVDCGPQTLSSLSMLLVDVIELTGADAAGANDPQELFLLCLADRRFTLRDYSISLEFVDAYTTWTDLLTDLAAKIDELFVNGLSFTWATIDERYLQPDPGFFNTKPMNCAALIDLIADSLGMRAVCKPYGAGIELVDPLTEGEFVNNNLPQDQKFRGGWKLASPVPHSFKLQAQDAHDCRAMPGETNDIASFTTPQADFGRDERSVTVASTYVIERFGAPPENSQDPDEREDLQSVLDAVGLIERIGVNALLWESEVFQYDLTIPHNNRIWDMQASASMDYMSYRHDGATRQPVVMFHLKSMPHYAYPKVNLCQRGDLFLYPHDVAEFQQDSDTEGTISPAANWGYNGVPPKLTFFESQPLVDDPYRRAVAYYRFDDGWSVIQQEEAASVFLFYFTANENFGYTSGDSVEATFTSKIKGNKPGAPWETGGGDSAQKIYDPLGLHADIVTGCSGIAVWNTTVSRAEVVIVQRPLDRVYVTLKNERFWGKDFGPHEVITPLNWSILPYLHPQIPLRATNPLKLDSVDGGGLWLQRSDSDFDEGEGQFGWYIAETETHHARMVYAPFDIGAEADSVFVTPDVFIDGVDPVEIEVDMSYLDDYARPKEGGEWKAVFKLDPILGTYHFVNMLSWQAKMISGTMTVGVGETSAPITVGKHWEGFRPPSVVDGVMIKNPMSQCGEEVSFTVVASYDRANDEYVVVSTESAWLGPPKQTQILTGPMTKTDSGEEGTVCYEQNIENVLVFDCGSDGPLPIPVLCISADDLFGPYDPSDPTGGGLGLCKWICENCPQFATPDNGCGDDCENDCDYTWNVTTQQWDVASECGPGCQCPEPPDPPSEPSNPNQEVITVRCVSLPPPPCGTCSWLWNGTVFSDPQSSCTSNENGDPCTCGDTPDPGLATVEPGQRQDFDCVQPPPPPPCGSCSWLWSGTAFSDPISSCTNNAGGDLCVCSSLPDPGLATVAPGQRQDFDCVDPPVPCDCLDCNFGGGAGNLDGAITGVEVRQDDLSDILYQSAPSVHTPGQGYGECHWYIEVQPLGGGFTESVDLVYNGNGGWDSFGPYEDNAVVGCGGGLMGVKPESYLEWSAGSDCEQTVFFANERPGHAFVRLNPEFFAGCGCAKALRFVMDRWTKENLTPRKILNAVKTIQSKNKTVDVEKLTLAIYKHFIGQDLPQ